MRPDQRPGVVCLVAFGGPLLRPRQIGFRGGTLARDDLRWRHDFSFFCGNGDGRG